LVVIRDGVSFQKKAVTVLTGLLLERQGNQVAKAAFGECVLAGEKAVIGI
jgi:hypothetical protein